MPSRHEEHPVYSVCLDGDQIRFSPTGEVSVLDAISALTGANDPESVWEGIKRGHPRVLSGCREYRFQGSNGGPTPVADSQTWFQISVLLFSLMSLSQ